MIATCVKAWSLGLLLSIVLFGLGEFGTHTPLQLAFLFVLPFFGIAVEIARASGARPPAEVLTNSLTLLFSTGFYGAIVFFILRRTARNRHLRKPEEPVGS